MAEMTTRSRVREQVAEGSSKKREKRRQRRKNQKEKMKEGQTRVLNKEVSTEKGEEMSLGSLVGQNYRNTHNKQHTQLLEIVHLPVAARKQLGTVY